MGCAVCCESLCHGLGGGAAVVWVFEGGDGVDFWDWGIGSFLFIFFFFFREYVGLSGCMLSIFDSWS